MKRKPFHHSATILIGLLFFSGGLMVWLYDLRYASVYSSMEDNAAIRHHPLLTLCGHALLLTLSGLVQIAMRVARGDIDMRMNGDYY